MTFISRHCRLPWIELFGLLLLLPAVCLAWNHCGVNRNAVSTLASRRFTSNTRLADASSFQKASSTRMLGSLQVPRCYSSPRYSAVQLQAANNLDDSLFTTSSGGSALILVVLALALGVAANGWIGQLMNGRNSSGSGLADFLRDGRGYQNSAFSMDDSERAVSSGDPLPWLKLPKLDYVQVAGQEDDGDAQIIAELERLRGEINKELVRQSQVVRIPLPGKPLTVHPDP